MKIWKWKGESVIFKQNCELAGLRVCELACKQNSLIMNKRKRTIKLIFGLVVILGAMSYFIYAAAKSSWAYYYSVDEFAEATEAGALKPGANPGQVPLSGTIRLAGKVVANSLEHTEQSGIARFRLAGNKHEIEVAYEGPVAGTFQGGKEVLVEGRWGKDGIFKAEQVLTRCESKYKARLSTESEKNGN